MIEGIGRVEIEGIDNFAVNMAGGRSEAFEKQARTLSDYIKALPLDLKQNDELVAMITNNISIAETDAFKHGMNLGLDIGLDIEKVFGNDQ